MNDGGPAFPRQVEVIEHLHGENEYHEGYVGMSLRDYFAAQALVGLYANRMDAPQPKLDAEFAYLVADEMLKAREAD